VVFIFLGARGASDAARLNFSLALQVAALVAMPLLAPRGAAVPVALMGALGAGTALLQATGYGLAARFPPAASAAFMLGQGCAGAASSALQIAIKGAAAAGGGLSDAAAATGYFFAAAATLAAAAAAWAALERTPEAARYLRAAGAAGGGGAGGGAGDSAALLGSGDGEDDDGGKPAAGGACGTARALGGAARKVSLYIGALVAVFFVTFLLFPGVLCAKIAYRGDFGPRFAFLGGGGWWAIILLAAFNIFDTAGRGAAGARIWAPLSARGVLGGAAARAAFVGIFLACALHAGGAASGDAAALVAAAAFAFTNGLFATLAFVKAPAAHGVAPAERRAVGQILSLSLNFGIVAGSNAALAFAALPAA
jgi:hypothetical protein